MVFLTMARSGLVIWQKEIHCSLRIEKFDSEHQVC